MNVYKDFVIVHNMTLDPRDVKLFADWLLACEKDTQAYKIGEAMQAAVDNYVDTFKIDVNNKYGITNYCDNLNFEGDGMNTGCFKCAKAQWDADGCTCERTGLLVGNAARGCEYRKDMELKPCPFCGSVAVKVHIPYFTDDCYMVQCYGCNCNTAIYMTIDQAIEAWNRRTKNE